MKGGAEAASFMSRRERAFETDLCVGFCRSLAYMH